MIENHLMELLQAKAQREGRKISLRQVVRETGIHLPVLSRWKRQAVKQFDGETLERLCLFLGCEVGELITLIPQPLPPK